MSDQAFSDANIITDVQSGLGVVAINRPKALNALTLEMIRVIAATLSAWETDPNIKAVLFYGMGDRAFSAGGDIKAFYKSGMKFRRGEVGIHVPSVYFETEYAMNKQIFHYTKPTIGLMNGVTMGGGYGIAGNCRYRIVTDETLFAMPEVGIGFFPDVGSVYHFVRSPGHLGRYLALTGMHIKASDMMHAKLGDYFIQSEGPEELVADLVECLKKDKNVEEALKTGATVKGDGFLSRHDEEIKRVFSHNDLNEVLKSLENMEDGEFKSKTMEILSSRSPTSVFVTAEHLKRSQDDEFDDVIQRDLMLARKFLKHRDLYEGIKAAVIDREHDAQWDHSCFDDVQKTEIDAFFTPDDEQGGKIIFEAGTG